MSRIKEAQEKDEILQKRRDKVLKGERLGYTIGPDGILRYQDRLFLPNDDDIKQVVF